MHDMIAKAEFPEIPLYLSETEAELADLKILHYLFETVR